MQKRALLVSLSLGLPLLAFGCASNTTGNGETAGNNETASASGTGTINLVANGEAFVRQGFVTKDGWQIDFDHVYVTLDDVKAYQSDPAFNPDKDEEIKAKNEVTLVSDPTTVDLAKGGENADPIMVTREKGKAGFYNAISWKLVTPEQGEQNSAIVLDGTAQKDGRTIDFVLNLDQPIAYKCGEYVGDARKGFLKTNNKTQLEMTFHFDHIFGDAEAPADDAINTGAVGFDPMAKLADNGMLKADMKTLKQELSSENYQTLENAIKGLGHVGEGHCAETTLN
ncbi:MAG: DUF4382 domain-containing protein [Halothece sp.]